MWECTRQEQSIGAAARHPMTTHVKLGAKTGRHADRDAGPRRLQHRSLRGHGGETLAAALGSPIAAYRCVNKKADGYAVYTNMVPAGAVFAATAPRNRPSPSNAPWTISRGSLGSGPFEIRRMNRSRETDRSSRSGKTLRDVEFGSYGIDQCLDLVETALEKRHGAPQARRRRVAGGHGRGTFPCSIQARRPASLRRRDTPFCPTAAITSRWARPRWATARPPRTARSPPRCSARARATSTSSTATPIRPPTTRDFRLHRHGRRRPGSREDRARAPRRAHRLCRPSFRLRPRDCRLQDNAIICGQPAR